MPVVAVALAMAAPGTAAAPGSPTATASLIKGGNYARDCIARSSLDRSRPNRVGFTVWCSLQSGAIRFTVRRRDRTEIAGFSRSIRPTGSGAAGAFHCHRVVQTVKCAGHKRGPLVIRGWLQVTAGTACEPLQARTAIGTAGGAPRGCPHAPRESGNFDLGYMRGFRRELGLDTDLDGNRAAIDRRIRGIIRAWRHGEPVARVTASEYGQPLRRVDERRMELRYALLERTASALETWVPRHAADTYAGYWIADRVVGGPFIYVGFTGDQDAQLEAFKRQVKLVAPARIRPFPTPPRFSESELGDYEEQLLEGGPRSEFWSLANSIGMNVEANRVEVGTEHVASMKRLLLDRFGTLDPFLVVFQPPGELV